MFLHTSTHTHTHMILTHTHKQMQCIASFFALYVPYDFSLHERLTALESYGLRYISPLLVIVVIPFVIRIR